jgi:alanine-synthesizing transaminase
MSTTSPKPLAIRERLSEVRYEIRGELARRARELEAQGRKLIKLNIGNPGNFGFRAPEHLQRAIADDMGRTDPYTHQQGLPVAREAIAATTPAVARPMRTRTASSSATASAN